MPAVTLQDRAFIQIAGNDATSFLQGLITTDIQQLAEDEAWPGALLTPQGKIMFEFLINRKGEGYVIEIPAVDADAFERRLTIYRLRAQVTITRLEDNTATVFWDGGHPDGARQDHRFRLAGLALWRVAGDQGTDVRNLYDQLRIEHGIAEAGADYGLQDAFPHDALYDKSGAVSFRKGCYIGQEVVSRMQHRSTARKRVVRIAGKRDLPPSGTPLTIAGRDIGILGSIVGAKGLGVVRIDKVADAVAGGIPVMAGDIVVEISLPDWSGLTLPQAAETGEP